MDSVQMENQEYARLTHHRAVETLSEVLSELSTRLLTSGRRQFAEMAPSVFQAVARIYVAYADISIAMFNNESLDQTAITVTLDIISICVRCLRILMVSGIKDVHKYNETKVGDLISAILWVKCLPVPWNRPFLKSVVVI
jgi:hypothetical protein